MLENRKNFKTNRFSSAIKRNLVPIFTSIMIVIFFLQPYNVQAGTLNGIKLWYTKILPSLFPMFFLSNILLNYNLVYSIVGKFSFISKKIFKSQYGLIPYIVSMISGYPSGAYCVNLMVANKKITVDEGMYLISFTNLCGFQFILAVVVLSMLNNISYLPYIIIPHYISSLIFCKILDYNICSMPVNTKAYLLPKKTFSETFTTSLSKSINSTLTIAGTIIVFSIISQYITSLPLSCNGNQIVEIINNLLIGSLEMTNGCNIISTSSLPIEVKIILINYILSFSGLSVIMQTAAVAKDINFSIFKYIKVKFLQGLISSLISILMLLVIN